MQCLLGVLLFASSFAQASAPQDAPPEPALVVGSPAPALAAAEWVHGAPVAEFERGKLYLVEFLSTQSSDSRSRLPVLSAIQERYRDRGLTVVGVTGSGFEPSAADVRAMLDTLAPVCSFSIAWDDGTKTREAFLAAAGRKGVPSLFLIDGAGRVAYVGKRWSELALQGVLAGDWNREVGDARIAAAKQRMDALKKVVKNDPARIDAAVDAMSADYPLLMLRRPLDDLRFAAYLKTGEAEKAAAVAGALVDAAIATRDPARLNTLSWTLVDPAEERDERCLDVALRAAEQAVEYSGGRSGAILDTLARVWFWKGDYAKALALQERALAAEADPAQRALLEPALAEYRALLQGDE